MLQRPIEPSRVLPQVWAMKRDELGAAARRLLAADKDIQQRCLGASVGEWQPPSAAAGVIEALAASGGVAASADKNAGAAEASGLETARIANSDAAADIGADASSPASERSERRGSAAHRDRAGPDTALWGQLGEVVGGRRYAQWRAAEKELEQHFALLQAREAAVRGVNALRAEHQELRERIEQLRRDPINEHLQLPPSLFLNGCLSGFTTDPAV